jgi:fluoride ion exporter CrcB/FEX
VPIKAKLLGYVFLGGVLGTMLRYLIFEAMAGLASYPTYELIALFLVNLSGAFFLGITARYPYFQLETCRNLWGVGFAGSFTTMSALTLWIDYQGIGVEVVAMLAAGFGLYWFGFEIGRKASRRQS